MKFCFFTDSDVVLPSNLLERAARLLVEKGGDALIGSYDMLNPNRNLVSQYKTMWIYYTYMQLPASVSFLFGAVCAVRRRAFFDAEGFRSDYDVQTGGEDMDLGLQLKRKGYQIRLDPSLAVINLRRYSFTGLMKNDFFRSSGYIQYAVRQGIFTKSVRRGGIANINASFTLSMGIIWLFLVAGLAAFADVPGALPLLVAAGMIYLFLNYPFIRFFKTRHSFFESIRILPIMMCDHLVCGIGCLTGLALAIYKKCFVFWGRTKLRCLFL